MVIFCKIIKEYEKFELTRTVNKKIKAQRGIKPRKVRVIISERVKVTKKEETFKLGPRKLFGMMNHHNKFHRNRSDSFPTKFCNPYFQKKNC